MAEQEHLIQLAVLLLHTLAVVVAQAKSQAVRVAVEVVTVVVLLCQLLLRELQILAVVVVGLIK
jgi:hypothetical protein